MVICISWILEVLVAGIDSIWSVILSSSLIFLPQKAIVLSFIFFACFKAIIIFSLCPEVVIPNATSPVLAIASICLENKNLNPRSLPIAVKAEVSVVIAIAAIAFLFLENLTVSSVAICCESDALPPFPKIIIFLFFFKALTQIWTMFLNDS